MADNHQNEERPITIRLPTIRGTIVPHPPSILTSWGWLFLFGFMTCMCLAAINMAGLTPALSQLTGGSARAIATNVPPVLGAAVVEPGTVLWDTTKKIWSDVTKSVPFTIVPVNPPGAETAAAPTAGAVPTATLAPTEQCPPVSSTPMSLQALALYKGVDASTAADLDGGADVQKSMELSASALSANCGDKLAAWVYDHAKTVAEAANRLPSAASAAEMQAIADEVLARNPRVLIAYWAPQWARISEWTSAPDDNGKELLSGVEVTIAEQSNGGSLANLPDDGDRFKVQIHSPGFGLKDLETELSWQQLNAIFGEVNGIDRALNQGAWKVNPDVKVKVPGSGPVPSPLPVVSGPSDEDINVARTPTPAPPIEPSPTTTPQATITSLEGSGGGGQTYTVKPGDTLFKISRQFGVTVDALRTANGLTGDRIDVGQVLQIP